MLNLNQYINAYDVLYKKAVEVKNLANTLNLLTMKVSQEDITDLAIKQIHGLDFSIEDQHEQIESFKEFLQAPELNEYRNVFSPDCFDVRLFTAVGVEKSIFLGTELDWFNISDYLSNLDSVVENKFVCTSTENTSSFDKKQITVAVYTKIIEVLNVLRTCELAINGYALRRVNNVLGANCDFYVEGLLPVCLNAQKILQLMADSCKIEALPLNQSSFDVNNAHLLAAVSDSELLAIID